MATKNTPKTPAAPSDAIQVMEVSRGRVTFCLLGTTPLLYHRLAQKAKRELLMPSRKKNKNEKETTLKHDPYSEFRDSMHTNSDKSAATLLQAPSVSFKSALSNAAIDIPGSATKAAIGRLCYVEDDYVDVYGVPKLHMAVVRMSNMERTPDIRTRACLPQWACRVTVSYVRPILNEQVVGNLMAGAGIMQGIGDFRTQKGKGNFGSFELVEEKDPRFQAVLKLGRKQQVAAVESPEVYDSEAAELLEWFTSEAARREFKIEADAEVA